MTDDPVLHALVNLVQQIEKDRCSFSDVTPLADARRSIRARSGLLDRTLTSDVVKEIREWWFGQSKMTGMSEHYRAHADEMVEICDMAQRTFASPEDSALLRECLEALPNASDENGEPLYADLEQRIKAFLKQGKE